MVASKNQSIWFIVLSALKLAVGIVLLVLCKLMVDAALALSRSHSSFSSPSLSLWWLYGMPYMVTAISGFVAAKTKQNGFVGLYMALNIIAMVVAGAFAVICLLYVTVMSAVGGVHCQEVMGQCYCSTGNRFGHGTNPVDVPLEDCDSLNQIFGLLYGVTAMVVIGWCLCLAASIVCCSACCCPPASTPGAVYVQPDGYTTTIHSAYPIGAYPPPYVPPPVMEAEEMVTKENFNYNRMP